MLTMPVLRPAISLTKRTDTESGRTHYYIYDLASDTSETIDQQHYDILKLWQTCENQTTLDNFIHYAATQGHTLNQDTVIETINLFSQYIKKTDATERKRATGKIDQSNVFLNKLLMHQFNLYYGDTFISRTYPKIRLLFSKLGLIIGMVIFAIALWFAWPRLGQLYNDVATSFISLPLGIFFLVLTFIISKTCHELSHAYMAKKYGVTVKYIGIKLFTLLPVFYVNTEAFITRLDSRKQINIYLAGILGEFYFSIICLIAWLVLQGGLIKLVCAYQVGVIFPLSILFNLRPASGTDGAKALAATLDIDRIETKSIGLFRNRLYQFLFNIYVPISIKRDCPHAFFILNGISNLVFIVVGWFLITAIALNFLPLTMAIVLSALMFYMSILVPLLKEFEIIKPSIKHIGKRTLLLLLISTCVCFIFWPTTLRIPVTVFYQPVYVTTPDTTSLIQKITLKSGHAVKKDTLIIQLKSPALQQKIAILKSQQHAISQTFYHDILTHKTNLEPVIEQMMKNKILLSSAQHTAQALTIYAPSKGIVNYDTTLHVNQALAPKTTIATFYQSSHPDAVGFLTAKQLDLIRSHHAQTGEIIIDHKKIKARLNHFALQRNPISQSNWLSRHIIAVGGTIAATVMPEGIIAKNRIYAASITPLSKLPTLAYATNGSFKITLPSRILSAI